MKVHDIFLCILKDYKKSYQWYMKRYLDGYYVTREGYVSYYVTGGLPYGMFVFNSDIFKDPDINVEKLLDISDTTQLNYRETTDVSIDKKNVIIDKYIDGLGREWWFRRDQLKMFDDPQLLMKNEDLVAVIVEQGRPVGNICPMRTKSSK